MAKKLDPKNLFKKKAAPAADNANDDEFTVEKTLLELIPPPDFNEDDPPTLSVTPEISGTDSDDSIILDSSSSWYQKKKKKFNDWKSRSHKKSGSSETSSSEEEEKDNSERFKLNPRNSLQSELFKQISVTEERIKLPTLQEHLDAIRILLKNTGETIERLDKYKDAMYSGWLDVNVEVMDENLKKKNVNLIEERSKKILDECDEFKKSKRTPPAFENDPIYYYSALNVLLQLSDILVTQSKIMMDFVEEKSKKRLRTGMGIALQKIFTGTPLDLEKMVDWQSRVLGLMVQIAIPLGGGLNKRLDDIKKISSDDMRQIVKNAGKGELTILDSLFQSLGKLPGAEYVSIPDFAEKPPIGSHTPEESPRMGPLQRLLDRHLNLSETLQKNPKMKKAIESSTDAIYDIREHIRAFNNTDQETGDILTLIMKLSPGIQVLRQNREWLKRWCAELSMEAKDAMFAQLNQLNTLLCNSAVELKALEMQLCLASNRSHLLGLDALAKNLAEVVDAMGYRFADEMQYPWAEKIYARQKAMLDQAMEANPGADHIPLWRKRVEDSGRFVEKSRFDAGEKHKNLHEQYFHDTAKKIGDILQNHHAKLSAENLSSHSAVRHKKLILLKTLKEELKKLTPAETKGKNISKILSDRLKKISPDDYHLMWEGRTRKVMKDIDRLCRTPNDRLVPVDIAITGLEESIQKDPQKAEKNSLHPAAMRLAALRQYRQLLSIPGCSGSAAELLLQNREPGSWHVLSKNDQHVLNEVNKIERLIPADLFDRFQIDRDVAINKPATGDSDPSGQIELISQRIGELERERQRQLKIFSTTVKFEKIRCLAGLRSIMLIEGLSLTGALNKMMGDRENWPQVDLLYEGRTGKLIRGMIKAKIEPRDTLNRLDLEIQRLEKKRATPVFFFPKTTKSALEKQISALEKLRNSLGQQSSTSEAWDHLGEPERDLLKRQSRALLEQMGISLTTKPGKGP